MTTVTENVLVEKWVCSYFTHNPTALCLVATDIVGMYTISQCFSRIGYKIYRFLPQLHKKNWTLVTDVTEKPS